MRTGCNGEVVYRSPEPGAPVENALTPASDLTGTARRIAERVHPAGHSPGGVRPSAPPAVSR
ncbi:hypothetical protein ACQP10_01440 [Streptosporangium sandarakinum]|uniref:hypothetical protein n=1 Tax=Streptosporangium sandarakinum TaxID=1260955 RepID=UPI003D91431A